MFATPSALVALTSLDASPAFNQALSPWKVWHFPLIQVHPLTWAWPEQRPDWVLWTSPRAVALAMGSWPTCWTPYVQHAVIGHKEHDLLLAYGIQKIWQAPKANGIAMATALIQLVNPKQVIVWPSGTLANPRISDILNARVCQLKPLPLYETKPNIINLQEPTTAAQFAQVVAWVFTSPSAVRSFVEQGLLTYQKEHVAYFGLGDTTNAIIHQVIQQSERDRLPLLDNITCSLPALGVHIANYLLLSSSRL